ncbi:unnamed protein product [Triticum turgidum subsp. durum]|uniref:Uncharacterized protein n=1 Tax=Triticum turgidum subsp. durum TaxID=4567 RepID=A0A9R1S0K3_TRITD|nr:unnamed protein product [Triticum turgidum subsp. durum]
MARRLNSGPGEAAIMAAVVDGNSGNSALHLAAMEEKMDVCRYLVEDLRLDINQTNDNGETPLFLSAFFGRTVAAKYLLAHDADPKLGEHQGIVKLLLSRGIDVDIPSPLGTPLHLAATYGQDGTMKILLEHHADPNKVLNLDDTPLSMAIRPIPTASVNCVKLLIKAGADVNFTDSNGGSYVALAATCGSAGIMNCLLEAGANPNIADEFGITPIEVAASQGKREIVEMLFPVTSPISKLPDWSIDGIISHVKTFGLQQYKGHPKDPTIVLEAVALDDLWIWHSYFGLPGSHNDLNVLSRLSLFGRLFAGDAPPCNYVVNDDRQYTMGYYLADGIYLPRTTFVKTTTRPKGIKRSHFAMRE